MANASARQASGPAPNTTASPASPSDRLAFARTQMSRAMSLEGFSAEGIPVCPNCHKAAKGKGKIFQDGAYKCHACGFYARNAVDFLTLPRVRRSGTIIGWAVRTEGDHIVVRDRKDETRVAAAEVSLEGGAWSFAQAVDALCGADVAHPEGKAPVVPIDSKPQFRAEANPELYQAVLDLADLSAAQEFYGRWHIDPQAVADSGARMVVDQVALLRGLRERFTPEDLIAAGLATPEGFLLVNERYPICEPHRIPDGRVVGLQFRASVATEREIAAHKAYKARVDAGETGLDKVAYVPKFLSLNGTALVQRPGFGLHRLAAVAMSDDAEARRRVYIVEGFKDVLAANTMGLEAFGLPGAAMLPVKAVCRILSRFHEVHVALDGDEAGERGTATLVQYLTSAGLRAVAHPPPAGQDITDVLVARVEGQRAAPSHDDH